MAASAIPPNMTVSFSDVELTFGAVVCESHLQHILRAKSSCRPCEIVWDWAQTWRAMVIPSRNTRPWIRVISELKAELWTEPSETFQNEAALTNKQAHFSHFFKTWFYTVVYDFCGMLMISFSCWGGCGSRIMYMTTSLDSILWGCSACELWVSAFSLNNGLKWTKQRLLDGRRT